MPQNKTIFNKKELIKYGNDLILNIKKSIKNFHIKSDAYEILTWEISCIDAHLNALNHLVKIPENLKDSVLLSDWGKSIQHLVPDIVKGCEIFYKNHIQIIAVDKNLK